MIRTTKLFTFCVLLFGVLADNTITTQTTYDPWESTSYEPTTSTPWTTTEPAPIPFSIQVVNSNVPTQQYLFDAVGILQVYLQQENSFVPAITKFYEVFIEKYDDLQWKLACGYNIMWLSNQTLYIKLYETYTHSDVVIFV